MAVTYVGDVAFEDAMEPRAGKSDWGMDTLTRKMKGASTLLTAFLGTLNQGDIYFYRGQNFYLQTWEADDDPVFSTVTLNHKGLRSGIPAPAAVDETTIQTTSIGADISSLSITNADGTTAKTATRDIEFYCPQTTWRYITNGRPTAPTYSTIANGRSPIVIRSTITLDNGTRYTGNAPIGLVTALTPALIVKVLGPHDQPIFGTPYFECEDVVQYGYFT